MSCCSKKEKKIPMKGIGVSDVTMNLYLRQKLGCNNVVIVSEDEIRDMAAVSLLQKDYGEAKDCTVTSITAFLQETLSDKQTQEIYNVVEKVARKYGYTGNKGTNPLFVNRIVKESFEAFGKTVNMRAAYLKGVCYDYDKIKDLFHHDKYPMIFNINNDGRDCYKDHSVLLIGYRDMMVLNKDNNKTKNVRMLEVYDNWHESVFYIDYDYLSMISSINYRLV